MRLQPKDFDKHNRTITLRKTKGQLLRVVPYGEHISTVLKDYIKMLGYFPKGEYWQNSKRGGFDFLFPILAINKIYKAYFLKHLKIALEGGTLSLPVDFSMSKDYNNWKENLYKKKWVVYTKPPFSKPENVVNYLARYSHRIAISNQRIIDVTDTEVTFTYKDYRDRAKLKTRVLQGKVFLQRFCLHIVPDRFRKIRHFGFLSNSVKMKCLSLAKRSLLDKQHLSLSKTERKEEHTQNFVCLERPKIFVLVVEKGSW